MKNILLLLILNFLELVKNDIKSLSKFYYFGSKSLKLSIKYFFIISNSILLIFLYSNKLNIFYIKIESFSLLKFILSINNFSVYLILYLFNK